jgi:hypothetical protein
MRGEQLPAVLVLSVLGAQLADANDLRGAGGGRVSGAGRTDPPGSALTLVISEMPWAMTRSLKWRCGSFVSRQTLLPLWMLWGSWLLDDSGDGSSDTARTRKSHKTMRTMQRTCGRACWRCGRASA